jgi:hypothetical protein
LATINSDGSLHVDGGGARWVDGAFRFETGQSKRKGRNLARDPRCTLSVAALDFDLVVDGEASLVTDPPTVAAMAEHWAAGGWPCGVDDSGIALTAEFSAPSAGPPLLVRLSPHTAHGHGPAHRRSPRRLSLAVLAREIGGPERSTLRP